MIETFTVISGLIALWSVYGRIKNPRSVFWVLTTLLILFYGLRWEMGTDWTTYIAAFEKANVEATSGFEPGYNLYSYLIRSVTDNYSVFLVITSAITFGGIFYPVFRMTEYSFISLFYLVGNIPWYAGSMRQMIAIVFFTVSLGAALDKRLLKFTALMVAGTLFHGTALVFYPIYWLVDISWMTYTFLFVGIALLTFLSRNLLLAGNTILLLFGVDKDLSSRFGGTGDLSSPLLGFMRKAFTIGLFGVFTQAANTSPKADDSKRRKIRFMMMLVGFSIILYYLGVYAITYASSRLDIYITQIAGAFLIGYLDKTLAQRSNRLLLFALVSILIYVFYVRLGPLDLFHPYSSIFYNKDFGRQLNY